MIKKQRYTLHSNLLLSIFIASATLITPPENFVSGGILVPLIASVAAFLLIFLSAYIINRVFEEKAKLTVQKNIAWAVVSIFCLVLAIASFIQLLQYCTTEILPKANIYILAVLTVVCLCFFVTAPESAIFKFTLIIAVISALSLTAVAVITLGHFKLSNIFSTEQITASQFIKEFINFAVKLWLYSITPIVFSVLTRGKTSASNYLKGTILGVVAAIWFVLHALLIFGIKQFEDMKYPFTQAVGVVSTGDLFSRMNAVAYTTVVFVLVIKISVCLKTAVIIIKKLIKKRTEG